MNKLNKLSASHRAALLLVSFSFELTTAIFLSKSHKKSLAKMFPFSFQLSGYNSAFLGSKGCFELCSGFSVAMGDSGSLCLLKHLRTFAPIATAHL